MRLNHKSFILTAAVAGTFLVSCGKKDSSDSKAIEATSLGELKLSSSFKLDLPDSLKKAGGQTASLALNKMERKRSREACQAVSDIEILLSNLNMASSMACHLEAESAQIEFGTKYKINLTGGEDGDEDLRVWVDNSDPSKLTMYSCQGTKLVQKIVIDGSNSNGSSGAIDLGLDESGMKAGMKLDFNFKDQAASILKGQFSFSADGQGSFAGDSDLTLRETGVSTMKVSQRAAVEDMSFTRKGVVKSNGTFGQALMNFVINDEPFTYRESFDGEGYVLEDASTVAEEVKIVKSELPDVLAADFSIAAPTGWDCSVDETITVDMGSGATAAAHNACDAEDEEDSSIDCEGDDFDYGEIEND